MVTRVSLKRCSQDPFSPLLFLFFDTHLTGRGGKERQGSRVEESCSGCRENTALCRNHRVHLTCCVRLGGSGSPEREETPRAGLPWRSSVGAMRARRLSCLRLRAGSLPRVALAQNVLDEKRSQLLGRGAQGGSADPIGGQRQPRRASAGEKGLLGALHEPCWRGKGRPGAPRKVWASSCALGSPHVGRVAYVAGRRGGEPSSLGIGASGPEIHLVGFSTQQAGPPLTSAVRFGPARPSLPPSQPASSFPCARCFARNGPSRQRYGVVVFVGNALARFRGALLFGLKGKPAPTSRLPTPAFPKRAPSSWVGLQDPDGLGRREFTLSLSRGRSLGEVGLCSGVSPVDLAEPSLGLLDRSYPGSASEERRTWSPHLEFRVKFPYQRL